MHKNNLLRKGLVVGILVLFIGMSIVLSTGKIDKAICRTTIYNGSLSGYIKNTSGNPIEGALVKVHFHRTYEENYSDSTGYYHVANIPICKCLKFTTCSKENYKTKWVLLGIAENTTRDFILTYKKEIELVEIPVQIYETKGIKNHKIQLTQQQLPNLFPILQMLLQQLGL